MTANVERASRPDAAGAEHRESARFEIRRLARADIPELIDLCREHAVYESAIYEETGQADRLADALFGAAPSLHGWFVLQSGAACGFMTATIDFATWTARSFVHMDCLYLRPEARGKGAGRALIASLRDFARQRDCDLIQWQTPPSNELGIRFYDGIGAVNKPKLRYFLNV